MKLLLLIAFFVPPLLPPTGRYAAKHEAPKVVMFTASYCGPCQVWKRNVKPVLERDGIKVIEIDITQASNRAYKIQRLPTFWIIDGESHSWQGSAMVGSQGAETIRRKLREPGTLTNPPPIQVPKTVKTTAVHRMTHSDLVQLHNSLHGGGHWTWHGDLKQHLRTSHGVHLD